MKDFVSKRGIKKVLHFTRAENVERILREGLIPRTTLEGGGNPPTFNDEYRIDGQENASCVSISFPNYKMFYPLRKNNQDVDWAILTISPNIIWEKDCAFCVTNAAARSVTDIPIEDRKNMDSLKAMFGEFYGGPKRASLDIPERYTTNPQAEILIFGTVEPEYIVGIDCQKSKTALELKKNFDGLNIKQDMTFFQGRRDWRKWRE